MVIDKAFSDDNIQNKKQMRGIKDTNLFNSALYEPMQTFDKQELYPDIISKGALNGKIISIVTLILLPSRRIMFVK